MSRTVLTHAWLSGDMSPTDQTPDWQCGKMSQIVRDMSPAFATLSPLSGAGENASLIVHACAESFGTRRIWPLLG